MNTGALHRFGERLLDGTRAWGSVEIRPGRFGIVQYRLVVYPPGLSRSERRWLRLARGWPVWGFMVWLLCQIVLTGTMTSWAVFGASTAAATGAGVVAFAMAGEARTRVRSMLVTTMLGYPDATAEANRDRLAELAAVLLEADDRLAHGDIGVVEHELIWWQVYDRLADSVAAGPHA